MTMNFLEGVSAVPHDNTEFRQYVVNRGAVGKFVHRDGEEKLLEESRGSLPTPLVKVRQASH